MIELKRSDRLNLGKNQIDRYTELYKLPEHNASHIFFVDPDGAHADYGFISFKELERRLKSIIEKASDGEPTEEAA